MIFESVDIENFMSIGKAKLRLDNTGLVLIQGENFDDPSANSNGAAKSTIGDAIYWCLYGETARGVRGDEVIKNDVGKGTKVEIPMTTGDEKYIVRRYRKHKTGKSKLNLFRVEDDGTEKDLTKGKDSDTQALLNKVIGCSKSVFMAAVYAAQEAMPDLPSMNDRDLKELIEEAAGVSRLIEAYQKAVILRKDKKEELERAELMRDRVKSDVERTANDIEVNEDRIKGADEKKASDVKMYKVQAAKLVDDIKTLKASPPGDKAKVEAEIEKCRAQISSTDAERKTENDLVAEYNAAKNTQNYAERDFRNTMDSLKDAKEKLDKVESQVGEPCDECGKPYEEADLAEMKKVRTERVKALADTARKEKDTLPELRATVEEANKKLTTHRESMTDVSGVTDTISALTDKLREIDLHASDIVGATVNAKSYIEMAKARSEEENPYTEVLEAAKKAHDNAVLNSKKAINKVTDCFKDFELANAAARVFAPAGVRAHIIDTVTPYLNDRTAHYLGTLSDGMINAIWSTISRTKTGDLREKFKIEVQKTGASSSFAGLSGGEKRKVRLACALALQDLVASRAAKPIGLWIGDEIDDALDSSGLERLMGVLEEKARERGSVLIISHNDMKDWVRETVTVTRRDGDASVSGVLC